MIDSRSTTRFWLFAKTLQKLALPGLAALLCLVACGGPSDRARPGSGPLAEDPGAGRPGGPAGEHAHAAPFQTSLKGAVADPGERTGFQMEAGCARDSAWRSVKVFESGVSIWNDERQFQLTEADITTLLHTLDSADFASLPEQFGGAPEPERMQTNNARSVVCSLRVSLAGLEKRVLQINRGEQSESFAQLVNNLLDSCEEPAAAGIGAESLEMGLEMVASRELDPVTFGIHFQRMNDGGGSGQAVSEFILDIGGVIAATRLRDPVEGYSDPIQLELSGGDVSELAWKLAERDPTRFPKNLWAPSYTDMTLRVLNQKVSLIARPYRGISQETHGEIQQNFDATVELLDALHERVLLEGSVDSTEDR